MSATTLTTSSENNTIQRNIQDARSSLQTAISQLGLVLRFHRDVKALGVESYAAKAPGSITRPLAQAIKDYNDACDAMELELMKARHIIVHDMTKSDTPPQVKSEETESSTAVPDASLASGTEHDADKSHSAQPQPDRKPILLEDDEMEDLFGSGNSTSISSPITALNQAAATAQSALNPLSATSETAGQSAAGNPGGIDMQMDSSNLGLNLSDLNDIGSTSTNADFSSMSANDFNSLLASLGAGGSGQQQQGGAGDLLGDFNAGNIDFSSFGSLFDGTGGAS